ncbi:hypothetical protein GCM10011273_33920 [Asticcacaulis endophyticus]|uniref:Uncharacterized protein n=1 Tax=Asticcacaulis endophyticus TaxID=1395890 RepID=A0A918QEK3_9CAUL|nr:hypothetical protein GCM10011273_33920 [Asticcacaulis endophyticus]
MGCMETVVWEVGKVFETKSKIISSEFGCAGEMVRHRAGVVFPFFNKSEYSEQPKVEFSCDSAKLTGEAIVSQVRHFFATPLAVRSA